MPNSEEELRMVETFQFMTNFFQHKSLVSIRKDPPDFEARVASHRIGIEVTNYFQDLKLRANGKLKSRLQEREIRGKGSSGGWYDTDDLKAIIQTKDQKCKEVKKEYEALWLLIYTSNSSHANFAGSPIQATSEIHTHKFNAAFVDYLNDVKSNPQFERIFFMCNESDRNKWVVEVSEKSKFLYPVYYC